jgi:hypothetical protein
MMFLVDPDTQQAYVLVSAEIFDRMLLDDGGQREQVFFL